MSKRNLWGYEETQTLITIIDEQQCLQKIEERLVHPNEIYTLIEKEMFARGYYGKNAKQIKFRWQNLRKLYYKDRKAFEKRTGKNHKKSPYYDQLHVILANRWASMQKEEKTAISTNAEAEDTTTMETPLTYDETSQDSSEEDALPKTELNEIGDMPTFEECFPSLPTSSKFRLGVKRSRTPDSTSRLDLFQAKIKQVTKELNEDLYKKQKELIEYEFRLFANYTTTRDEKFKEMMATNTQTFLSGIKELLQEKTYETRSRAKSERNPHGDAQSVKQFFQTWDHDSESKN